MVSPDPVVTVGPSTALRLVGKDVLALLHGISTQALLDLHPGEARTTLFCDFRGRVLHRALAAMASDGAVWLLRPDAPGADLAAFVDRHVFREDVRIDDQSAALRVTEIEEGDIAGALAERDGRPGGGSVGLGAFWVFQASGEPAGDETDAERRRIRAGRTAHGHEIVDAFQPYEIGLAGDVHLDKGCYTGQEALQRLITYDSVRRGLARVAGLGPVPSTPADVLRAGERVGVLTSAIADGAGRWIGLAVMKKEVLAGGDAATGLEVAGASLKLTDPLPVTCPLGLP